MSEDPITQPTEAGTLVEPVEPVMVANDPDEAEIPAAPPGKVLIIRYNPGYVTKGTVRDLAKVLGDRLLVSISDPTISSAYEFYHV